MSEKPPFLPPEGQYQTTDSEYTKAEAMTWAPPSFDIQSFINCFEEDEYGLKRLGFNHVDELASLLGEWGITSEEPADEDIKNGIGHAIQVVENGAGETLLRNLPFMSENEYKGLNLGDAKKSVLSWDGAKPLYINSSLIRGGGNIEDWTCESYGASKLFKDRIGNTRTAKPIEVVQDYATRKTQLPPMDTFGLKLILTDMSEPILFAGTGVHRVAAAKLRGGEPLGFSDLVVYDTRKGSTEQ